MRGEDLYSGSALGGAGTGAATGAMVGGVPGAIVGGALGWLGGATANSQRADATAGQQQNLDALARSLRAQSKQRYQQYLAEMDKALSFYGPAQAQWNRLYAQPGEAPSVGQGSWSNTGVK